ncbi:hypothetical protein BPAE_0053g00050 [Botrytis paeoniae]|uniref:Bud22 domain-containing protein n=1 Tax=Botrytis paeoniae TaxID=278948 RepID=A0A4Z1FUS1_9HELO|nr:hypothetical protein BPAE_0053g00050 [Botrytis paeoniae]
MPKRKRSSADQDDSLPSTDRVRNSRQNDFNIHLISARKQLRSALKTAKGFERQRLGKRLTNATKASDAAQMARIRKEIEALKTMDLDKVTEQRLARGLGKIKVMSESGFLPPGWGQNGEGVKGWEGEKGEEDVKIWNNVVSGMWNFKNVKNVWEGVIRGSYMSMGIPAPVMDKGKKGKDKVKEKVKDDSKKNSKKTAQDEGDDSDVDMENTIQKLSKKKDQEDSWEGFDSPGNDEDENDSEDDEDNEGDESMDEETLSRYDALLGASSDEESFDEKEYLEKNPSTSKSNPRLSLSLSPTPSRSPSPVPSISLSDSEDDQPSIPRRKPSPSLSPSPEPQPKLKKPKKTTTTPTESTKNSTFLPTLMGGYWSGSESASSLSDTDMKPVVRKNRMGQKARQALWEKKFGKGAKHIAAGGLSVEQEREIKRAEKSGRKARDLSKGKRGDFRNDTNNANMMQVKPREKVKTRDDVGVLHPSWEAAKKAKDDKAKATFSGKKVVFD